MTLTRQVAESEVVWGTPCPALRPGVVRYNGFRLDLPRPRRRLELPAATATLVIVFGGTLRIGGGPTSPTSMTPMSALLCGPYTRWRTGEHDGRLYGIDLILAPWAAFNLFGVPMHELADRSVDLVALFGGRAEELLGRLAAAPDWTTRFAVLDRALLRLQACGPDRSAPVAEAFARLARSHGRIPIAQLAADLDWDPRRLQRGFEEQIGVPPKVAARILRLRLATQLLAAGWSPARVANACAYYDQAHLTREFTAMTGCPPQRLVAQRLAMPRVPVNADRLSGYMTSIVLPDRAA